ncbi:EscU/YscU/HrcU family type III secretion system export apparatus switch protein [Fictibacillus phosphorivorans]|uniref:EscU/YscU/HrcU family type III secretion system export apparatus switch protein n=1 Tax=Fictibacillus phosphorivorans TaxID=1221500 RepID=UPI00203E42A4|nr:EscU/YscU/HrcU family type III secretion system export apparatus switch protein [Fictibacillus phosphorivorans]MCM3717176.1 EscU/YscU/HrcU family type III secretion system export apparatus switch protein [Fictibacillus phosphorivorans]MCM3774863.1 EscU/YscU/HrcU family type III secretion system export apparatus switch protein [Fictibacillus phosphorivorans]
MKKQYKEAVALSYNPEELSAPIIKAKGKGETAEHIVQTASQHNIPIQQDPSLVHLLSKLEIDEKIPKELFEVVAELFAFIYQIDQKAK